MLKFSDVCRRILAPKVKFDCNIFRCMWLLQTISFEYKLNLIDKNLLEMKLEEMKNLIDNKDN
jgi:hypothetical protein